MLNTPIMFILIDVQIDVDVGIQPRAVQFLLAAALFCQLPVMF